MKKIALWPNQAPLWNLSDPREQPYMELSLLNDGKQRPCVLVFPGGGYGMRADHEGTPIAQALNAAGFHAGVCHYRVQWREDPKPLTFGPLYDAQRAIRLLRHQAAEYQISSIATLGFSAGGHLCASTGVLYDQFNCEEDDLAEIPARPDAFVPCYAVLSTTESIIQGGTYVNLLGEQPDPELLHVFSLERQVDKQTPPCFLWHTHDDELVEVGNSLCFADAARKHEVPCELHVFPHGKHGLGLAAGDEAVAQWWDLCTRWLHRTLS